MNKPMAGEEMTRKQAMANVMIKDCCPAAFNFDNAPKQDANTVKWSSESRYQVAGV